MHITPPSTKRYQVKLVVVDDFDEEDESEKVTEKRKTVGILRVGNEK